MTALGEILHAFKYYDLIIKIKLNPIEIKISCKSKDET